MNKSIKRKHSATFGDRDVLTSTTPPLPLTLENLRRLERETSSMPSRSGSQSPIKRSASSAASNPTSTDADPIPRLRAYGIIVDSAERNTEVEDFIRKICDTPRDLTSPNAKRITARAGFVERASEATGRRYLQDLMLLKPAAPGDDDDDATVDRVWLAENSNLNRRFHPPIHRKFSDFGSLNQAIPDASIGYLTWQSANAAVPAMDCAFSRDEDTVLRVEYPLDKESHLPFLTAQYKGVSSPATVLQAKPQMARDGAIISYAMHCLFTDAFPSRTPSPTSTCHLSVACDMQTFVVYLHWCRPTPDSEGCLEFHMRRILMGFLANEGNVADLRRLIRNWVDWALGGRLEGIRGALREKSIAKARKRDAESGRSISESESVPEQLAGLPSPDRTIPELQGAVEPSKKRRLDDSNS